MLIPDSIPVASLADLAEFNRPLSLGGTTVIAHTRRRCYGRPAHIEDLYTSPYTAACGRCAAAGADSYDTAVAAVGAIAKLGRSLGHPDRTSDWAAASVLIEADPAWMPGRPLLTPTVTHPVTGAAHHVTSLHPDTCRVLGGHLERLISDWRTAWVASHAGRNPRRARVLLAPLHWLHTSAPDAVCGGTPLHIFDDDDGQRWAVVLTTSEAYRPGGSVAYANDATWRPTLEADLWPLVAGAADGNANLVELVAAVTAAAAA